MQSSQQGIVRAPKRFLQKHGAWGAYITSIKSPFMDRGLLFMMPTIGSVIDIRIFDEFGGEVDRKMEIEGIFSWFRFDQKGLRILRDLITSEIPKESCLQPVYVAVAEYLNNDDKRCLKIVFLDEKNAAVLWDDSDDELVCVNYYYYTQYTVAIFFHLPFIILLYAQ